MQTEAEVIAFELRKRVEQLNGELSEAQRLGLKVWITHGAGVSGSKFYVNQNHKLEVESISREEIL